MMRHWLATPADQQRRDWLKRFDARFWTVDFPRPMMAAATTPAARSVRVDLNFLRSNDLAGLIWESADRFDHPLLSYATDRDYRGLTLSFRWQSSGVMPLDSVNGPVLTIEGRDAAGNFRGWYIRLWNYAVGTPSDAVVTLDFDTLSGGFLLPGEADPVFAGDIDRLFISLVPAAYTGVDAPLPASLDASVTLSGIACDGPTSTIAIGDTVVPQHRLRMATGYDDSYNLTPERLLRGIVATGYSTWLNHYIGMSHFFQVAWNPASARYEVDPSRQLCAPAAAWHRDFGARTNAAGLTLIVSQSFELLAQHAPATWNQRDATGAPALTGYTPPSTLLSPCSAPAMAWLQAVAQSFVALAVTAGHAPHFQIGEPWWWVGPDHRPCFYDAATTAAYHSEGGAPPPLLLDARGTFDARNRAFADWLGVKLGAATLALRDAVRAAAPAVTTYLLFYAPQVLLAGSPELVRANLPAAWAYPAFDVLQLEDYEFVTSGNFAAQEAARAVVASRLGYPFAAQHYFAGFVARVEDRGQWPAIADAAAAAQDRGIAEVFVWAWPEVARDGFVAFDIMGDEAVAAFDDVCFPLAIGLRASGGPEFSTQISTSSSGYEQRNSSWAEARPHYDAGVGVRSEADLRLLLAFFRARRGQASGFRFTDPLDHSSSDGDSVTALDQPIGIGDGVATRFALTKRYGTTDDPHDRRITRPVAGSVVVAVVGAVVTGWALADGGFVDLAAAPPAGAIVTAGFAFDVPVRFADDRLDVSPGGWLSGDAASVPLIEIREG